MDITDVFVVGTVAVLAGAAIGAIALVAVFGKEKETRSTHPDVELISEHHTNYIRSVADALNRDDNIGASFDVEDLTNELIQPQIISAMFTGEDPDRCASAISGLVYQIKKNNQSTVSLTSVPSTMM
jgi:hypothetical protein